MLLDGNFDRWSCQNIKRARRIHRMIADAARPLKQWDGFEIVRREKGQAYPVSF